MGVIRNVLAFLFVTCLSAFSYGQSMPAGEVKDTTYRNANSEYLSLKDCIDYAIVHQPELNKALLNIQITRANNAVLLAPWLPQVNASGNVIHYFQQSNLNSSVATTTGTTTTGTTTGTGSGTTTGTTTGTSTGTSTGVTTRQSLVNSFIPQLSVSQAIFSPTLLYTSRVVNLYAKQAQQLTDSTKIFLVTSVTKSFYNLLLTLEQINVLREDTARLSKNVTDAYHQYKGGIVDETDYLQATITLNNSKAQLKQSKENIIPQYAILKQFMGYPADKQFNVRFDTLQMVRDINIDSLQQLKYEKRIEFQELNTQKQLQDQSIHYYHTSFLPTVSAFFDYNLGFQSDRLSNLFQTSYPSSLIGASISIPIFTGFARVNNLKKAKLIREQLDWNQTALQLQINREYTTALANYKGYRYNLNVLQKNVTMAERVYFVVTLQYKQGIIPYLNVITAESNLITSKINYINALFQVLSSKVDFDKAMGNITY